MSSNDPDYVPDAWIESPYRRRWDEDDEGETTMTREWMVYQIGSETPNKYRFVVIQEGSADSAIVEADLAEGEFIDTTSTLSGVLNGEVSVIVG